QGKGSNIFTCWPDGSDLYAHCGGGMDNPVEVDFTDTGDVLGTVNILYRSPRIDCLVHWLHGGAYPHYESVLGEYKKTGDLLGPIYQFGHVAVSGTCRYRSGLLERHFRDDMFVTIFNTGKVMRCEVDPSGSTYSADAAEFLSCSDPDFHPTDILEDADGSLLLIDTGGWFRIGCPTSQIEKPDILGGIYRIRKTGMPEFHDPRGIAIDWDQLSNTQLIALLGDTRYAVRDRAIDECAQRGEALIPLLAHRVKSGDILPRQNAIWALTRMRIPDAMKAVHPAFGDREPKIREIACHSVAATRDASAKELLLGALKEADHPHIVRQAIRALGRIGDSEAVRPLLAQAAMATDRALEHAAIYAVIEINDPQETAKFLSRAKPSVQRAALIALDQMDNQILSEQILRKALAGPTKVQATAMWVLMHRPEWNSLIAETVDNWLQGKIAHDESTIPSLIGNGQQFPDLIAKGLAGEDVPEERKLTILDALMQAPQPKLVEEWVVPLTKLLTSESRELQTQAMRTVARFGGAAFDPVLDEIALDEGKTIPVRMAALDARVSSGEPVSVEEFSFLMSLVDREGASASRDLATQILSRGVLTSEQLSRLVPLISVAGPIDLRSLMKPFERCRDEAVLGELIDALARAKSLASLTSAELTAISKRWPEEPSQSLGAVFEQLGQQEQKRVERLTALEPIAKAGSAVRGHEIFFSEKAKCVTCHRVGEKGGKIGPDLSAIGRIRRERDLLEAILFPSVSFAREFEPYAVATSDGKVFTGLIVRETEETITIQQQTGDPVSIARDDIEQIAPSPVSIMPQGLDTGLTDEQIGDLVAYLRSLQTPNTQSQEKLSAR
ncbi:MAG: HEAT repeat domain-containing protein, partial [Planctomycetaceae bacterium]|nr:HEAT repeat domain-containing protein [Planctomycetaceae bacterium]